jgi:serine/threonine protein kinase
MFQFTIFARTFHLHIQKVFRKADPSAIDLISKLLEYTPTQRLSAIEAMVHPFFDELRDPNTRFPDSRHPGGATKDMPELFNFNHHGKANRFCEDVIEHADISRTLNCTPHEQPTRSCTRSSSIGSKGPRHRQLDAYDQGCYDGTTGLRRTKRTKTIGKKTIHRS